MQLYRGVDRALLAPTAGSDRLTQSPGWNRIWCILTLDVTCGGNNVNDFPDNQLTKF